MVSISKDKNDKVVIAVVFNQVVFELPIYSKIVFTTL
jgi:hypothetical protein